jgi:ATP-dependent 26S proteasome regulatory subunit
MSVKESTEAMSLMGTPEFRNEISALIRSRTQLIYLVSSEEKRIIEYFRHYSIAGGYRTFVWDYFSGMLNILNMEQAGLITGDATDPTAVLDWIVKEATEEIEGAEVAQEGTSKGSLYVMLDFHRFLKPCSPDIERRLRTLARMDSNTSIIMVGPHYETTPALDKEMRVIDFPYPNKEEIKVAMHCVMDGVSDKCTALRTSVAEREEEIINSVSGLTYNEAFTAYAKSVVQHRDFHIPTILKEKQEIIRKTGILEFHKPEVGMDDVGGLGNLTEWLKMQRAGFDDDARQYGLPMPKGALLIGVPGGGKSLAAKAAANLYEMPLLRLDFGSLFNQFVGESERTARSALQVAERLSPCILWCDEIDKGLSGHRSSGSSDSGVTSRVIGTFLTWMQEKTAPVFIMCTANDHDSLPAPFLRAGRFDEIFFVDLPTRAERYDIVKKLLRRKRRDPDKFTISEVANRSDGYTGAELEKAIDMALRVGFHEDKREINTDDIVDALGRFKPLSVTRPEVIEAMRVWAEGRCIKANTPEVVPGGTMGTRKRLDMAETA